MESDALEIPRVVEFDDTAGIIDPTDVATK